MNWGLTDQEVDAVLQLIQFRRDYYADTKGARNCVYMLNFPHKQEERVEERAGEKRENLINGTEPEEALPRKKRKFRFIIDIYRNAKPLINTLGHKRAKNRRCP